ncbi:acyl-CoA dehydrogenase [Burkholderia sp. Ac-20345]|uniref:acyl-CoA dehydrogenase n=1 Tax=Burkholderia sp. Ac-20345 TaxID=2703891 RepID=UPI0004D7FD91|nr:acyl-CoA dehydrogenase [Burkholderia sp. Ac-20345]KER67878.1 acyl-CoA dehydrogenase [Burkholderia cepacia]MBN3777988.1 acyl-CoA dehydrogenase [Burkholderia sp. Ac-20345]
MNQYLAPIQDIQFALQELADLHGIAALPGFEDATPDVVNAILEEAGAFAAEVISPINRTGDLEGARLEGGSPRMPAGWRDAYAQFVRGGWSGLSVPAALGGQHLPRVVAAAVDEMWNGASVAFALLPMLTRGAINVLEHVGSAQLKETFLPRMVTGEWTGTMVLTEPQAGSDLSAVRTAARPAGNGTYRLSGTKIFITYGDHDLAENVIHLVLARVDGAPAGTRGISLFVVPKRLVNDDGTLGAFNDVKCVSLERKLGLHATPTCVLAFGDDAGAVGYLVGEENHGLENMFIMMNGARFAVGLEGIGLGERAYQLARDYARERVQGVETGSGSAIKVPIIRHPDVRRMLMSMKARVEAMRALSFVIAASMDKAETHPDCGERSSHQAFVDLMMPIAKGWFTEAGLNIASMGIQVHGGTGFIEETGAAQLLRDARITTIYEGTTGIQAMDLVGRKIGRDGAETIRTLIRTMEEAQVALESAGHADLRAIGLQLGRGIGELSRAVDYLADTYAETPKRALAVSVPFLDLLGTVACGWQMGRAALAAHRLLQDNAEDATFLESKIVTSRFYAEHVLPLSASYSHTVVHGAEASLEMAEDAF